MRAAVTSAHSASTKLIVDEIKQLQKCLQTVKEDVCNIKREMQTQQWQIDALEQYSRRDNIKTIDFPEPAQGRTEDTSPMVIDMREEIGEDAAPHDITSTSRRIPGRAKAILCKLVQREVIWNIMTAKKKLKDVSGTKIIIYDDLTSLRSKVMREVKKDSRDRVKQAFTRDGRIH